MDVISLLSSEYARLDESIKSQREIEKFSDMLIIQIAGMIDMAVRNFGRGSTAEVVMSFLVRMGLNRGIFEAQRGYRGPLADFYEKKLKSMGVKFEPRGDNNDLGAYDKTTNIMIITMSRKEMANAIGAWATGGANETTRYLRQIMTETIVHELTHAYDHFISGGKALTAKAEKELINMIWRLRTSHPELTVNKIVSAIQEYSRFKDKDMILKVYHKHIAEDDPHKQGVENYLRLPYEVNARYSQTVRALGGLKIVNTADKNQGGFKNYLNAFKHEFIGWQEMTPDVKNTLTKRLYKEYNNLRTLERRYVLGSQMSRYLWQYANGEEKIDPDKLKDKRLNVDMKVQTRRFLKLLAAGKVPGPMFVHVMQGVRNALADIVKNSNMKAAYEIKRDFNLTQDEWNSIVSNKYLHMSEGLMEAKQAGILYHSTTISGLKKILSQGVIKSKGRQGISTTRNANMSHRDNAVVRIALNGNKISSRYKIKPHDDFSDEFGPGYSARAFGSSESEEIILADELPLKPFVMRIDILPDWTRYMKRSSRSELMKMLDVWQEDGWPVDILDDVYYKSNIGSYQHRKQFSETFDKSNYVSEAKQTGIIYHFTTVRHLPTILQYDSIDAGARTHRSGSGIESTIVSFTRNFDLMHYHGDRWGDVRIAVDGNKLSDRYEVRPYNDFWDEEWAQHGAGIYDQDEEAVIVKNYDSAQRKRGSIDNLHKYIVQIDILVKGIGYGSVSEESRKKILQANVHNVRINFVDKFKPVKSINEAFDKSNRGSEHATSGHDYYWGRAGAGMIAVHGKKIMLCKRSRSVNEPHTWSYPGGKVDENEDMLQAAKREFIEETGYRGKFYEIRPLYTFKDKGFTYRTFVGFVEDEFEPSLNWENEDYGWFTMDELPEPQHPGFEYALPSLERFMSRNESVENLPNRNLIENLEGRSVLTVWGSSDAVSKNRIRMDRIDWHDEKRLDGKFLIKGQITSKYIDMFSTIGARSRGDDTIVILDERRVSVVDVYEIKN